MKNFLDHIVDAITIEVHILRVTFFTILVEIVMFFVNIDLFS